MSSTDKLPKKIIDAHKHFSERFSPAGLIEAMDADNIEISLVMGLPKRENTNDEIAQALQDYPGRFVGGVFVDPREPDAIDRVKRYHAQGLRVVKLFPNFGYYPDADEFLPFFETVAELNMAVLTHCGWLRADFGLVSSHYSAPGRFEKLVRRFTDLPFIFAHMGGVASFLEAIMLTTRTPNAYVDTSPGQGIWVLEHASEMARSIPPEKILWGADSAPPAKWIEPAIAVLEKAGFGEHLEKIFYSNARGLFETIQAVKPTK